MKTMVLDPVCYMTIDASQAAGTSEHDGQKHYFCATTCKEEFDADPAKFTKAAEPASSCCGGGSCSMK